MIHLCDQMLEYKVAQFFDEELTQQFLHKHLHFSLRIKQMFRLFCKKIGKKAFQKQSNLVTMDVRGLDSP